MIKIKVGDSTSRKTVLVDENTATPRTVFQENEVNYSTGTPFLDGITLNHEDFDKTFAELGKTTECFLVAVVKTQNA